MSHKVFDKHLAAIPKINLALKLNKTTHIVRFILELSKVWMEKSHYDYISK